MSMRTGERLSRENEATVIQEAVPGDAALEYATNKDSWKL